MPGMGMVFVRFHEAGDDIGGDDREVQAPVRKWATSVVFEKSIELLCTLCKSDGGYDVGAMYCVFDAVDGIYRIFVCIGENGGDYCSQVCQSGE